MAAVTPDVEGDLINRLIALVPSVFNRRNTFPGEEVPTGGEVPLEAHFVRWYGESRQIHYSGQGRELMVQIQSRHARDGWTPTRRAAAMKRLREVYDAIHLSGGWTATDGTIYVDIRAVDAPNELPSAYFALNVAVWYRG